MFAYANADHFSYANCALCVHSQNRAKKHVLAGNAVEHDSSPKLHNQPEMRYPKVRKMRNDKYVKRDGVV